jgi:hypothetical protein
MVNVQKTLSNCSVSPQHIKYTRECFRSCAQERPPGNFLDTASQDSIVA